MAKRHVKATMEQELMDLPLTLASFEAHHMNNLTFVSGFNICIPRDMYDLKNFFFVCARVSYTGNQNKRSISCIRTVMLQLPLKINILGRDVAFA